MAYVLMWHFKNNEQSFVADRFRSRSSFNPRKEGRHHGDMSKLFRGNITRDSF